MNAAITLFEEVLFEFLDSHKSIVSFIAFDIEGFSDHEGQRHEIELVVIDTEDAILTVAIHRFRRCRMPRLRGGR